jgi:hypothetical protein
MRSLASGQRDEMTTITHHAIAELPPPVPADVLAHVLDADLSLSIAGALLLEARVVGPLSSHPSPTDDEHGDGDDH